MKNTPKVSFGRGDLAKPRVYAGAVGRDLHIDAALTNLTIGYRPQNLIADQIYPAVPVDKQNNVYYVWTQADFFTVSNAHRAPGAVAKRIGFDVSSQTYFCREYALAMDLPLEEIANADAALNLRSSAANFVFDHLSLAWEDRIAVALTTTTNVGSNVALAGTDRWSDKTNSDPVTNIFTGKESIRSTTGYEANKIIFSGAAWNNFRQHPDIIDFVRGQGDNTGGGPVTMQQVAAAFEVSQVLVGKGVKNTADEGAPAAYTDIWSTACVILHVAANPGLMIPTHGYTFQWTPEGLPGPLAVDRYSERKTKSETVEVSHYQDERIIAANLGYLIVGG